ncbi:hypothetical protein [Streptacidiphilus melanogenes]|uniref:hypothetical protein n=1 Tax=Streptacidiphilus melanogenes TaxID=411235 RepID=UPI00126A3F77|nr:hypothetical protein [Streptacidiphilus melanogenes]
MFMALLSSPLAAPAVFLTAAAALLVRWARGRRRRRRPPGAMTWALVAVMAAAAVYGAYGWGLLAGNTWQEPDELCAMHGVPTSAIVTRETLPVSVRCVASDGHAAELVPSWVNPTIYAGLAVLAVAILLGARSWAKDRETRRSLPVPDEGATKC